MPGVPIPTDITDTFVCLDLELPQDIPRHIIGFQGFLNQTGAAVSHQHVHHMVSERSIVGVGPQTLIPYHGERSMVGVGP